MAIKTTVQNDGAMEKMAAQINEIHSKVKILENFYLDMMPGMDRMAKEINATLSELRIKFEREETLQLLKTIGDNVPTFLTMMKTMEAFKGFFEDFAPAVDKMVKELMPTINTFRYLFENDETFGLLVKTGENVPAFSKLLDFLYRFDKSGDLDFTLNTAFAKETEYMIKGMEKCAVRTMQQVMEKPLKPGMKSLFSSVMDPEVQKGFILLTTFARNMPQCMMETIEKSGEVLKGKNKEE
ncbi:MAG: hypothetical protein HQK89_10055 [Nitrospirae bacterium]|nr:hypothetical protein [Nitrospirota bacterium]